MTRAILMLAAGALATHAQGLDPLSIASPNREIEFRLFIGKPPEPGSFIGIAYQVSFKGKPLLDTSFLGLDIYGQEPLLGENVGLLRSRNESIQGPSPYNSLLADYMQNGSLGRLVSIEVRVFNDGVAFRYVIPRSTPLDDLQIANEITEFNF